MESAKYDLQQKNELLPQIFVCKLKKQSWYSGFDQCPVCKGSVCWMDQVLTASLWCIYMLLRWSYFQKWEVFLLTCVSMSLKS